MSTLSEFMEERAQAGGEREPHHAQSTSRGPVVVLRGWREGMDKVAVTTLLRSYGVPLAEAHRATESVLRGEAVAVRLRKKSHEQSARHELEQLGVML